MRQRKTAGFRWQSVWHRNPKSTGRKGMMKMSDKRFDVSWTCPFCGQNNMDNFKDMFMPFCDGCKREIFWEDILSDRQIEEFKELQK